MSAANIITSLTTQVSTTLGANWSELKYVYDIERNEYRNKNGYGVGVGSSNTVSGTNKASTYDLNCFVVLTETFNNRVNDSNQRVAIANLLTAKESIDTNVFQKKLNNASVLLVQEIGMDEPTVIDDSTLSLRFNYIIKYRIQT